MNELITQAEYARRRGVSREAVRKALATARVTGVPANGKVMIDSAAADIEWARNTDARQQKRGAPGQCETTQQRAMNAVQGQISSAPAGPTAALVRIANDALEYAAGVAMLREALVSLPARLATQLAATNDASAVREALATEIRRALTNLPHEPPSARGLTVARTQRVVL